MVTQSGPSADDGSAPAGLRPWSLPGEPEGVLVFGPDGALLASTAGERALLDPPIGSLADLEARYRQSDGMPLDLARRGRHVGIPISGHGPRTFLLSEPLAPVDGETDAALVVAIIPFRTEEDPQTLQRALGSVLAHELRTPMTTVYGGAELLTRSSLSPERRAEAARSVASAADQLHRVVEDLVLLVRWSTDNITEPEPVLLQPILRGFGATWNGSVPVDLDVQADLPPVLGSEPFVGHLVRNLLSHAGLSSPTDGRIGIAAAEQDGWVRLTVSDEGPARSLNDRERAFELFAPTARQSVDPSGANLALVAARRLVERLGGRIRAGDPAVGGETIVELPIANDSVGGPPGASSAGARRL